MKKRAEKRKHARFPILEYALVYTEDEASATRALIVDISLGGAQVRCRSTFPEEQECILQIARENGQPLEIPVSVRYCFPVENQELHAIGLQFIPKTRNQKTDIVNYVHSLFLNQGESMMTDYYP